MQLKKTKFIEEDKTKNCLTYPTDKFPSYSSCDNNFLKSSLPSGLEPIWLAEDIDTVTTLMNIEKFPNNSIDYGDLLDGTQTSDCHLPCVTTFVETRLFSESSSTFNGSLINLTFSPTISITTTSFLKFIFAKFLSDLGGCMGLWLGLSMFQLVETLIKCRPAKSCKSVSNACVQLFWKMWKFLGFVVLSMWI